MMAGGGLWVAGSEEYCKNRAVFAARRTLPAASF
jgi:hypothetical protein